MCWGLFKKLKNASVKLVKITTQFWPPCRPPMKIVISSDLMSHLTPLQMLPNFLPTCLPTYLPKYPPAFIPKCLANYLPWHLPCYLPLSTLLPTYLSAYPATHLPTHLPTCLCKITVIDFVKEQTRRGVSIGVWTSVCVQKGCLAKFLCF